MINVVCVLAVATSCAQTGSKSPVSIHPNGYFVEPGVNLFVFNNPPGGLFFDSKTSGIEVIHQGERTVTNGDVRLLATPEQWDGMGQIVKRTVDVARNTITTQLAYPELGFNYTVTVVGAEGSYNVSVYLDKPLPPALVHKAGFNLEFLPSVYWDKAYLMDAKPGQFPRAASNANAMIINAEGKTEPGVLAVGKNLVLAPEDNQHRISIENRGENNTLMLFDGRRKAQNGWYVARSLIPEGKTGKVIEWNIKVNSVANWLREPVIGFSQIGYHPDKPKRAVIELDANDTVDKPIVLMRINPDGSKAEVLSAKPKSWGNYLRYHYSIFDFSKINEVGLYQLHYGSQITPAFPIAPDVFSGAWQPTLDFFMPVQMDHMTIKEAYRTWHGLSHMDDALQAPPNYDHFDLYGLNADLDTQFKPFEHIPGLNIGGWYDAGDYDIRTQSQYATVLGLVHAQEAFAIARDNTTVEQAKHYVEINRPDGVADIVQQIEHGTLALLAQHRALGHAIPGIVEGRLYQYPHLGDGASKTDNKIYTKSLDPLAAGRRVGKQYEPSTVDPTPTEALMPENGNESGRFDDRWAFTSNTSALNYGSAAALAAASRILKSSNRSLALECLATAQKVWLAESKRSPNLFHVGNTTGGRLAEEQLHAAVELLLTTREPQYAEAIQVKDKFFGETVENLVLAAPLMDATYNQQLRVLAEGYVGKLKDIAAENPYGVPITRSGWAGNGVVLEFGIANYWIHKQFPDLLSDDWVYRSLAYLLGTHPDSNYSFVSGVGAQSQTKAYGNNRADFSFIPGGIVPGVLILAPDYPENKSDWPFFWGENEYVIPLASRYIFLTHAAEALATPNAAK
jgi:endoglucanase